MATREKINKQAILLAALELVRNGGDEALNARSLAKALGCSTQPVFRNFESMEALRTAVLEVIHRDYLRFCEDWAASFDGPAYKASGMAYIAYSRQEPRLFRALFMRSRDDQHAGPEQADWEPTLAAVQKHTGMSHGAAELFHLEMWAVVHGIAVMQATGYLNLDEPTVSRMLTDAYQGIRTRWEDQYERH